MALEGTLEDFSLADIFQLIGIQRKTGILTLKSVGETVTVTFHNGMVVGADSSPKKLEDRLGKVLMKTGLITPDQLKEALELQQKTLQKIGFIMVDQRYLTREELKEALQIQVAQMIYRLFRWNTGEYFFDQKSRVDPNADEAITPMSAESILMEGIQMIDEWPLIQKRIPDFSMVFKPMIRADEIATGTEEEEEDEIDALLGGVDGTAKPAQPAQDTEKVRLNRDEEEIFRLVDGKNTVSDIIESSKLGEFHTCKSLHDLLERKIIESLRPVAALAREAAAVPMFAPAAEKRMNLTFAYPVVGIVVAVLLFLNVGDPLRFATFHFFSSGNQEGIRTGLNASRLGLVDSAIMLYFSVNGKLPESLADLVTGNYLRQEDVIDSQERPFFYEADGNTYQLAGKDAKGQPDDAFMIRRALNPAANESRNPAGDTPTIRLQN
jgi:hypothetical protein